MNKKVVAILVAVSLVLIVGVALLGKYALDQRQAREARERIRLEEDRAGQLMLERDAGRAEAQAVFADPTRPTKQEADEFTRVMDSLGGDLQRGDAKAVSGAFDPDRMIGELNQIGAFAQIPGSRTAEFRAGMRKGLNEKFGAMLAGLYGR